MCFDKGYIHNKEYRLLEPRVASCNIPVFKLLAVDSKKGKVVSPFMRTFYFRLHTWRRRVTKKAAFDESHLKNTIIKEGIHAYTTLQEAYRVAKSRSRYGRNGSTQSVIHAAYIPKGATYYWNDQMKEAVTTRLVIKTKPMFLEKYPMIS